MATGGVVISVWRSIVSREMEPGEAGFKDLDMSHSVVEGFVHLRKEGTGSLGGLEWGLSAYGWRVEVD